MDLWPVASQGDSCRGVILDAASLGTELDGSPIDLSPITDLFSNSLEFPTTSAFEVHERLLNAQVVVTNKVVIDRALMAANPELKLICIAATGMNNVDLDAASEFGIRVCNVAGYSTDSVAQHTFALILQLSTRLKELQKSVRSQWPKSPFFCLLDYPVSELAGKTLGVVGYGDIGRKVSKIAKAFGMTVLIAQRPGSDRLASDRVPLATVYARSDIISLHCPLAENTHHLIDASAIAQMKPSVLIINTGRGGLVDEQALLSALQEHRIGGAGLDVLEQEPPGPECRLLRASEQLPNLVLTPHVAWSSIEARKRLIKSIGEQIKDWQAGYS